MAPLPIYSPENSNTVVANRHILRYLLLVLFLGSCAVDVQERSEFPFAFEGTSTTPLVLYITNPESKKDRDYTYHIRKTLNYSKIPFQQTNVGTFNRNPSITNTAKVLVLLETKPLEPQAMEAIVSFVANGGNLVLLNVSEDLNYGYLAGMRENPTFSVNTSASGFRFLDNFLPTMKGKSYQSPNIHYGLERESFSEKVKVLATAADNPAYPTILENKIMDGRVLIFNTTVASQKKDRGLFFAAILRGLPHIPYPIANTGVLFLDDFPAPVYDIKKEPVASEMDLSMATFYTDVWWPDMVALANDHNLEYTAMACFDYQNKTAPPFLTLEWEMNTRQRAGKEHYTTDWLMAQVVQEGHELALHGFNHVSLVAKNWPRQEYMETAMSTAYKKWKAQQYAPMPVTYVPPSNYIDSLGLVSIEMAVPSVKYICSTYEGITKEGGNREFDPDPYNQFFFNFPRISSGYVFDGSKEYTIQSTFLYTGVWSHFIHPDDVYQIMDAANESNRGDFDYRNPGNYGWRKSADGSQGMLLRFEQHLTNLKETYPLLRFMNTQNAAKETQEWRYQRFLHSSTETTHFVQPVSSNPQDLTFWMTYVPQKQWNVLTLNWKNEGVEFTSTPFQEGRLAMFKTTEGKISIPRPSATPSDPALEMLALQQFSKYTDGKRDFSSVEEEIAWLIAESRISEAIHLLKQKIIKNGFPSVTELQQLSQYLGYQDREFEIWPIMEAAYQANAKQRNALVDLSLQLVATSDYPSLETRKRWMERQLQRYPNNQEVWAAYIAYFSEELKNIGIEQLLTLYHEATDTKRKTQYGIVLASRDAQIFLKVIRDRQPCVDGSLMPIASTIAWLYADRNDYENAIAWSHCSSGIALADRLQWYIQLGDLEYVKKLDYAKYMEYLLYQDTSQAIQELMNVVACDPVLQSQATAISYAFANNRLYRKALEWAQCSEAISFSEKTYWYTQLNALEELEKSYLHRMETHPDDLDATYAMAQTYAQLGMIGKSWKLAATLPYAEQYNALRRLLNREIVYADRETQRVLLKNYPDYFFLENFKRIKRAYREQEGSYLKAGNEIIADRLRPNFIDNQLLAGLSFSSNHFHEFGATHTIARSLDVDTNDVANQTQNLYGVSYNLRSKNRNERLNYELGARLERSEGNDYFFRLRGQISRAKDSVFASLTAEHRPAVTGPAYALDIYNTQLLAYYENARSWKKYLIAISLVGNYYTDEVADAQLTGVVTRPFKAGVQSHWKPYMEVFGMLGNEDRRAGFPYWTIDHRVYGGAGLDFEFNHPKTKFKYQLGASAFADTFSDFFQRYRGSISGEILPYLYGSASAEFYTLKDFYSNNFTFGLRYYFKTR
jgi:hypothetical protein